MSRSFDGGPVGYGRPPVEHQFKPGQKPAGSGRRKGSENYESMVQEVLNLRVEVTVDGKRKKMPAKKALLRKALVAAVNGDIRVINQFFAICTRLAPQSLDPDRLPIQVRMIPGDETL
jgi:hypothetical protein